MDETMTKTPAQEIRREIEDFYNSNPAVRELNRVDGFNPLDFIRITVTSEGEPQAYMDVKNRKLWFRLKHPTGKIEKKPLDVKDTHATFEARVYADKNDAEENYLANSFATRYYNAEDKVFGNKFVELAEVAAIGRALSDAGFNIQGGNITKDDADPVIVDAGIAVNRETGEILDHDTDTLSDAAATASAAPSSAAAEGKPAPTSPIPASEPKKPQISARMSVEEIMKLLTVEEASKVVITEGYPSYRNKTLGWLAIEKPMALNYFKEKAQSNLLRAAAAFLLEQALQPAS